MARLILLLLAAARAWACVCSVDNWPTVVRSLILTSQLPVARWHEQIGDPTVADGVLDRLVHNAHRIEMRGDSKPRPSR
jgi:hypothetical protein